MKKEVISGSTKDEQKFDSCLIRPDRGSNPGHTRTAIFFNLQHFDNCFNNNQILFTEFFEKNSDRGVS